MWSCPCTDIHLHMYLLYFLKAFKTKDGYLVIGAGNNQQFAVVCKVIHNHQNGWMADYAVHFVQTEEEFNFAWQCCSAITTSVSCVSSWEYTTWWRLWEVGLVDTPLSSLFPSFLPFIFFFAFCMCESKVSMWRYPAALWVLENFCCCFHCCFVLM